MELSQHLVHFESYAVNYLSNNVINSRRVWLILTPGEKDGSFIKYYLDLFNKEDLIIVPDYPGRGKSGTIGGNSINEISTMLICFLRNHNIDKVNVLAISFGTMIATALALEKPNLISYMYLIAPGEYLSKLKRSVLIPLFKLPTKLKILYPIYRTLLLRAKVYEDFPSEKLDIINNQWLSTLTYFIPQGKINIPVTIVNFSNDHIVDKGSITKLKNLYTQANFIEINRSHPITTTDYVILRDLVKKLVSS